MNRKPTVPGQTNAIGEVFLAPTHGTNLEERVREKKRILTPRNRRRVRSHSKGRAAIRQNTPPQNERKQPLEHEKGSTRNGCNDSRSRELLKKPSPRKSSEWRTITSQLHHPMDKTSSASGGQVPKPHQFEISPSARSILAKQDQQHRGNTKSSNESFVSGKSKGTHTTTTHISVSSSLRSDKRPSSRLRDVHRPRPRLPESPARTLTESRAKVSRGSNVISGFESMAIYDVNAQQIGKQNKPTTGNTRIYDANNNEQEEKKERKSIPDNKHAKKNPMHQPVGSSNSPRCHPSRGRRCSKHEQVPKKTPVLTPKRGPPASDRSVVSRASSVAMTPLSTMRHVDQTVILSVESVKVMMADRKAAAIAGKEEISNQTNTAKGGIMSDERKTVMQTTPSSIFSILTCTNSTVDPEQMETKIREARQRLWLSYARRAILEANHGIETKSELPTFNQNGPNVRSRDAMHDFSSSMVESTVDENQSEDSQNLASDDEIKSISSVDLLVRWIGNCGEPDLSDHYPNITPQQKLKLHEAARTPRRYFNAGVREQRNFKV